MSEDDLPQAPSPELLARLREGFAAMPAAPSETLAGADEVAPEQIWAAVRGELEPEQTALIVDRLAHDPALALEWRLAMDLARAEEEAAQQGETESRAHKAETRAPANDRRYTYFAGALALAAAAGLVLVVSPADEGSSEGETSPVLRAGDTDDELVLQRMLSEGESLPREAFVLAWSCSSSVSHFELRLSTETLAPVYESTYIEGSSLQVPAEQLAAIASGTRLLWRVEAIEADGTRHASPLWSVVLR